MKVAINGFGRIGKLACQIALNEGLNVVCVNDPFIDSKYMEYMIKYDTVHGKFKGKVESFEDFLYINDHKIKVFNEMDPENLPLKALGVDLVIECSGVFKEVEGAEKFLKAGAKKVVISAPSKTAPMFVLGVNTDTLTADMDIVSNASCTTNCLAPVAKVLDDKFGIESGLMTTVHSLTSSQKTVDGISKKDWRLGRAGSYNIIPSTTGAAKAVGKVIPKLEGKLTGMAFRVPTVDASVVDLTVNLKTDTTYEEICQAMKDAANGELKNILGYTNEDIVSSDIIDEKVGSVFDEKAGIMLTPRFVKVVAWYDNEWGYTTNLINLAKLVESKIEKKKSALDKQTITDLKNLEGKKVFIRADFNVPLEDGVITDNSRIVKALDTIKYCLDRDAKIILCSHLGRPKGKVSKEFSMKPVADELSRLLDRKVILAKDVIGKDAIKKAENLKNGEILLLENVRFEPGEEENDVVVAKALADMADIYINDAFGTAHRAHASTSGICQFLPSYAGFLMEKEINFLANVIEDPERPFVAILGGAKVSDKLLVIDQLLDKVDTLLIGGGMAYTFLKAIGVEIGKSICQDDQIDNVLKILKKAKDCGVKLVLPVDVVVGDDIHSKTAKVVDYTKIPKDKEGLDIGPKTVKSFTKEIKKAKTVIWNGPVGVFENPLFIKGTEEIAKAIADTDCISVIGGGDSASAIKKLGITEYFSHISTGGGASLKFLEGKVLPGVDALGDR